jgi:MOSC domain-containing protein YiiM
MTGEAATIDALLVGPVARLSDGRTHSGIRKSPTRNALWLSDAGLQGDAQADLRLHGGPEKVVHHYPREHYAGWASWSRRGDLLGMAGAFGENVSTTGWDESNVCVGDVVRLGEALVQVSQGRQPCWKLDVRFGETGLAREMQARGCTGWYYRTLEPGWVRAGARAVRVDRPHPDWPLARVIALLFTRDESRAPEWEIAGAALARHLSQASRSRARGRLGAAAARTVEARGLIGLAVLGRLIDAGEAGAPASASRSGIGGPPRRVEKPGRRGALDGQKTRPAGDCRRRREPCVIHRFFESKLAAMDFSAADIACFSMFPRCFLKVVRDAIGMSASLANSVEKRAAVSD